MARSASVIASVPLATPTASRAPQYAANSCSNADTFGPRMKRALSITPEIAASMAGRSGASGVAVSNKGTGTARHRSLAPGMTVDPAFWKGRSVLVTGHTGFKGAWLTLWLQRMGADVRGLADAVPTEPSLYALAKLDVPETRADVRDKEAVAAAVKDAEVVIHMAAQPFVRRSFREPRETYEINVMGTVNVLDAARQANVSSIVVVTSDKCYDNREQGRPFVEDDPMGGHDPYSNSKGCAELVSDAYRRSFDLPLASARAGNVIGGGDWGEDRLIPDI